MKKIILIIFSIFVISACSSTAKFGNFSTEIEDNHMIVDVLALDITKQITTSYIPAKTKFQFTHDSSDNLGQFLGQELRLKGFAVGEYKVNETQDGHKLSYIVDHFSPTKLLVRIYIDNKTMSRLYNVEQNKASPSGLWSISTMEL